jgi:hypothetical protein
VSTYPRQLLVDRAGLSSPTSFVVIITNNHLHHQHHNIIAAANAHGQCQRRQDLLLLPLATLRNSKQKIWV